MPESVKDQIDAMLNIGLGTESPSTEAAATSAPATESAATSAPSTGVPATDAPSTKASSTEAPATTASTTAVPGDDELRRLREENERLRQRVDKSHKETLKTAAPTTAAPVKDIDFLGEDTDLDELTRNTKIFNALLNKVHRAGIEAGRRLQESTLKNIPDIVKSNVAIQDTLRKKVTKFYNDNKDLAKFKKVVSAVYEELSAENPDWNIDKIFGETEAESRRRLELYKKAASTDAPATRAPTTEAPGSPRFPKTRTSRQRQKPKTSALLSEIDEMNKGM